MLRSPDMHFVMELAQGAEGEAALGRLAAAKANSSDVKDYGRLMADDYTKLGVALKALATPRRATLPEEIPARQLALKTKLDHQAGPRFDRTYTKAMVKDRKVRIKSLKREIKKGRDPAVQQFASETLPVVEDHLEKARSLYLATKAKKPSAPASGMEKKP